jgi:hypothetical protein
MSSSSSSSSGSAAAAASAGPCYTWVTEAPIVHVPPDKVPERVAAFVQNIAEYGAVPGGTALAARMNTHAGGATFIAGLIKAKRDTPGMPVFEYRLAGAPVALMQIFLDMREEVIEIKNLTTHPGTMMAGGIMVEYALNKITFYNKQGAGFEDGLLSLESLDEHSTAAYMALGFTDAGRRSMVLDANKSELWSKPGGIWRLAKFAAAKFSSAT